MQPDDNFMNKEKAIAIIESLYPADSEYPETAEIGKRLLFEAKMNIENWRNESEDVLIRYAELCIRDHGQ